MDYNLIGEMQVILSCLPHWDWVMLISITKQGHHQIQMHVACFYCQAIYWTNTGLSWNETYKMFFFSQTIRYLIITELSI